MNNTPRRELNDEKQIDRAKEEVDDGQEVTRPHILGVILQEGRPVLRRRFGRTNAGDVFLDGSFGDVEAEFEQFPVNTFRTLQAILGSHLLDQGHSLLYELGASTARTGFEFPEQAETLAVPTEQGVGFENEKDFLPMWVCWLETSSDRKLTPIAHRIQSADSF